MRHATLKAESVRKDRVAASAPRDPQGGVGGKDRVADSASRNPQGGIGGKDRVADSASRDPQGGAGEKDVLEAVVTRHKLH